jgi:hypothetical protein
MKIWIIPDIVLLGQAEEINAVKEKKLEVLQF